MSAIVDLAGKTFGRLTVTDRAPRLSGYTQARWVCRCDCGNVNVVFGYVLRRGAVTSCGCRLAEMLASGDMRRTHGMTGSPEHVIWAKMRSRCCNPADPAYRDYGGRGITVCDQWRSFSVFLADMGRRPEGKTLDRRDNDGPYSPDNCHWASRKEQVRNRRTTVWLECRGERLTLQEWAERIGISPSAMWVRYRNGHRGERLLAPPRPDKRRLRQLPSLV